MLLIKDIRQVRPGAQEQWLGGLSQKDSFGKHKWALVSRAMTDHEHIVSVHVSYEEAKAALSDIIENEDDI